MTMTTTQMTSTWVTSTRTSAMPTTTKAYDNACQVQERGAGPVVDSPDTPAAFLGFQQIKDAALQASTPSGYTQIFQNLQAAFQGDSYLTYKNLDSYSPEACAAFCDSEKCSSFNIYFERAPSVNPNTDANNQTANCPNPPSTTYIRCALYGAAIDGKGATNSGQFRGQFQVVIAGSNGYSKPNAPISCPGFQPPKALPGGAIGNKGKDWLLGDKFFAGGFNPNLCRIFSKVQTAKNIAAAKAKGIKNYSPCNSFNAFEVYEEGQMIGTYCKLFTETLPIAWAEWKKEVILGKTWECKNSWFYDVINKDFGRF
ncbi:hypothetical protein CERZMDRAFT_68374 [Cercospora zeae-maydis SCOH1-5]|uniref:Apple domain-containing protein n=1 Tax=Cercospora zeae-maydis SCOH1-5 TaxID=717836 RepID=A0A6A6FE17_9PEZI|nr:hypothetical protein CERZMDRAFT_68374 [Cercospora zeae-maydis SCOH1-5]